MRVRAGRLKTRRYKVYRSGRRRAGLLLLIVVLGIGAAWAVGTEKLPLPRLPVSPAATLTPEDASPDARTLTLPGKTWFALQLGAPDSEAAALELAEVYAARGAGGYIWRQGGFRVLAAAYETRSDAQAVQNRLSTLHQVETVAVEIARPEVTLRVTGQKAQLTALSDAYDALDKLAAHLSALSQALDGREKDAEDVRSALQSERDTLSLLRERLAALFGGSAHAAVTDVEAILSDLITALDQAISAQGATALGAKVKYCQLLCVCRAAAYAAALAP